MPTNPPVTKSKADLSRMLARRLEAHPMWGFIVDKIVLHNCTGKVYLVGGAVSRILCEELYGTKVSEFDFDFVVQKVNKNAQAPAGWEIGYSKFGNPTFTKGDLSVDLWPISDDQWIKQKKLKAIINNFFEGTPFTIQAMAYDVKEKKVIGNTGIKALLSREFKVNNPVTAMEDAKRKGVTVDQRLELKAKSMDFKFVPSEE